jgi:hypothetical protein
MQDRIYQLFDKTFKKILTLSSKSVINLINGLFQTDYPTDSRITYNWTEFEDDKLKKILADTILTVEDSRYQSATHSYHMEAQMEADDSIVFRVFEYGFSHALRTRELASSPYVLQFPKPIIIYLYHTKAIASQYDLTLDFGDQGTFCYRVPALDFQSLTVEEMNDRKLVILIPFYLLKLRKILEKDRSEANKQALIHLIQHDIIETINRNLEVGNITLEDAQKLNTYTQILYHQIYSHYEELEEVNEMTDESFMTEVDILYEEIHAANAERDAANAERDAAIAERDAAHAERDAANTERDSANAERDAAIAEIKELRRQIAKFQGELA